MNSAVIVGVDGSDDGYGALEVGVQLAQRARVRLVVVHATTPARLAAVMSSDIGVESASAMAHAADAITEDCRMYADLVLAGRRVEWSFEVYSGDPATSLQEAARANEAGWIVVGRHGKGRLARVLLGSVVNRLVNDALVPVVVVPHVAP